MGRPRTRSLTKAGGDHSEDIVEAEQTEETLSIQPPKPKRQSKLNGQTSRQSSQQPGHSKQVKKSASIGRPKKSQSNEQLLSDSHLKYIKRKSDRPKQKSKLTSDDDDNDEDELVDIEDYDNEGYDDNDDYDEDVFEEVDDPRDKDYSPKDYIGNSSSRISKRKSSAMDFHGTPGTRLPNGKLMLLKNQSPVRPEIRNLIQGSPSSGSIPNLVDPSMKISLPQHPNQSQYPNCAQSCSQGVNMNGSNSSHSEMVASKSTNHTERIMSQNNCIPIQQIPSPRAVPIPTNRNDANSQSSQNEYQRISHRNDLSQTNHRTESISSHNIQDQYNHQHSSINQERCADAAESTQNNNMHNANTTHISEPQETGRTSCDICNSTGCTTQKTSTTITIKMTTVTEADQYGNMTTRTFVETDISPVTGTIESTEQTEITVETSEHPSRSNVPPTISPVVTDQNRSNETSSPATPPETEVQGSEKNQNLIDQQQQMSQEPVSTSVHAFDPVFDPISDPVSDPVSDPDPDPDPDSDPISDPISNSIPESVVPVYEPDPKSTPSTPISISESTPKTIPQFIPQNLSKITAGFSSCSAQGQAVRLENANVMQHNQALQSLLNTTKLNLSNSNSSQSHRPRINRPILPAQSLPSLPRPERLKHNIESIVNPIDLPNNTQTNPSNLVRNQTPNLATPANSMSDVVRTNSATSPRNINGSPSTQQSQQGSNKKKTATRKRSASKSTASPTSKRKNKRILSNKSPSEPQIAISPYMMKAGNTNTGNNSSMQDVTSSPTEVCSSQNSPYKPLICSTAQSIPPYFNSATPPRPPILNTNDVTSTSVNVNSTNSIPTITPPHNNSSGQSLGTASTTPHSNSTIQPSNSSTPQVSSSSNTCVVRDSFNNPFVVLGIGGSSSENTPTAHYNNNEILVRSGSSSKTISTNGGGVGYDSRSSSVANSIEPLPPYYHIPPIETIGSVTDIWNEWSAGIDGNPSVILMMERYGGKWVFENEYHLKKRRIIVKEVQIRSEQIGIYEAVAELERLRGGNSLLWLADRIRTREQ